VELYKGGHHGSYTANTDALLSVIQPKLVCICACVGNSEYASTATIIPSPLRNPSNRIAPYTDRVYCTTLGTWGSSTAHEPMNGSIVVHYDSSSSESLSFSNNSTKLKDTAWFKANRTTPPLGLNSAVFLILFFLRFRIGMRYLTDVATDVPTLTDLSGINIYLFTGLDNDAGAASTSITITTTTNIRFHLAKILFTLNGAPDTTTSSSSAAASSTPSSSTDSTASSSTDPAATTITFTSSTSTSKSYTTGNYGTITSGSFSYGYYRTYQDTGTFVRLVAPSYTGSLAGSFYNTEAIKQITGITLSYKMASSSDSGAKLYTGSSSLLTSYQSIAAKTSQSSLSFTFPSSDNIAFFRVDGGTSDFTIYSLSISYVGSGTQSLTYGGSGDSLNRINPLVYSGTLTSGVSSIAIPSTISQNGSTYTATTSKTYTYYTYAAVKADTALVDAAAYTEPADVAAYFIAFGTYPANYVTSSNFSSAYSIFGSKTRCVSTYNKTSGYVTAIPARLASSGTATYDDYYECDIDLTGSYAASSSPNRGVGRVIVFTGGFDSSRGATGYTYDPVAIFTDDHYATFQEYFNYGDSFSHRFDAELFRTSYQWGTSTVLSAA
jgi:hypothetical protein